MQPVMKLIPPRLNYLKFITTFVISVGGTTALLNIFVYEDYQRGLIASSGIVIGSLLGVLLMWVYDEIKKYERWSITLTENSITVPQAWYKRKTFLLSKLDRQRTLEYNGANNRRNRTRYTFWSTDGTSVVIGKSFYGKSQLNALLEKIGLPMI